MSYNLGVNVQTVLKSENTGFATVVFQAGKPMLDSEFNLNSFLALEQQKKYSQNISKSGWLSFKDSPSNSSGGLRGELYSDIENSNTIILGSNTTFTTLDNFNASESEVALVNGWTITVGGTGNLSSPGIMGNILKLADLPAVNTQARIDLIILEVWLKLIDPVSGDGLYDTGSGFNLFPFGNINFGPISVYPDPEIINSLVGFESSKRVQIQYSLRTIENVGTPTGSYLEFDDYITPNNIGAKANLITPSSYYFTHQIGPNTLNDSGLWRAGDGSNTAKTTLGTVDGYSYCIPVCAVQRFNSAQYNIYSNPQGSSISGIRPDLTSNSSIPNGNILDLRFSIKSANGVFGQTSSYSNFNSNIAEETFQRVITDTLDTNWEPGDNVGSPGNVYGTEILQSDGLSRTDRVGINDFGSPDGVRRNWLGGNFIQWSSWCFKIGVPISSVGNIVEWDGVSQIKLLTPQLPENATIVGIPTDANPLTSDPKMYWIDKTNSATFGATVSLSTSWAGNNTSIMTATLNTGHANYLAYDEFVVMYGILYPANDIEKPPYAFKKITEVRNSDSHTPYAFTSVDGPFYREGSYISPTSFQTSSVASDKTVLDYSTFMAGTDIFSSSDPTINIEYNPIPAITWDLIPRTNRPCSRQIILTLSGLIPSQTTITVSRTLSSTYKFMSAMAVLDLNDTVIPILSQSRTTNNLTITFPSAINTTSVRVILNTNAPGLDYSLTKWGIVDTSKVITFSTTVTNPTQSHYTVTLNSLAYQGACLIPFLPSYIETGGTKKDFVFVNGSAKEATTDFSPPYFFNTTDRTGSFKFNVVPSLTLGDVIEIDMLVCAPLSQSENLAIFHLKKAFQGIELNSYLDHQKVLDVIDPTYSSLGLVEYSGSDYYKTPFSGAILDGTGSAVSNFPISQFINNLSHFEVELSNFTSIDSVKPRYLSETLVSAGYDDNFYIYMRLHDTNSLRENYFYREPLKTGHLVVLSEEDDSKITFGNKTIRVGYIHSTRTNDLNNVWTSYNFLGMTTKGNCFLSSINYVTDEPFLGLKQHNNGNIIRLFRLYGRPIF